MADNKMNVPGGMGGLMRYDEEYSSKFMLSPKHVVAYIIILIVLVTALKVLWPITA